jgi:flagellar P-ring protein FlgI
MSHDLRRRMLVAMAACTFGCGLWTLAGPALAGTTLKNICRIKGQEENTLQGMGLVVGLKGTGDGSDFLPTIRSLATAMQLMGSPVGINKKGQLDVKQARNVALVMVTATVPAAGARQGDKLDCVVSSIGSSKSLAGGRLLMTPLTGPRVQIASAASAEAAQEDARVYAFADGALTVDNPAFPTTARVHQGCRLEEEFFNPFVKDNKITLVLDKNHADFQTAQDVAGEVNRQLSFPSAGGALARALNQVNIEVVIPPQYRNDPVDFVAQVLGLQILEPHTDARVVVNERTGSVVISGDVEIGAAVVTHKNVVIETGANLPATRFFPVDSQQTSTTKLKSLVEALNAVKVPNEDIIDIIKGLERDGKLHGRLIIE